jgi:SOS-response transcriptional repressor LexA
MSQKYSREELLTALRQYIDETGDRPTVVAFRESDRYPSPNTYQREFGSWNQALKTAGIGDRHEQYSRELLLDAIQELTEEFGRPPSARELHESDEHPSRDPFEREFGSWADAVEAAGYDSSKTGPDEGEYHPDTGSREQNTE